MDKLVRAVGGIEVALNVQYPQNVGKAFLNLMFQLTRMTSPDELNTFIEAEVTLWVRHVMGLYKKALDVTVSNECVLKLVLFMFLMGMKLPPGASHLLGMLPSCGFVTDLKEKLRREGVEDLDRVLQDVTQLGNLQPCNSFLLFHKVEKLKNLVSEYVPRGGDTVEDLGRRLNLTGDTYVAEFKWGTLDLKITGLFTIYTFLCGVAEDVVVFWYWIFKGHTFHKWHLFSQGYLFHDWETLHYKFKLLENWAFKAGDLVKATEWKAKAEKIMESKQEFEARWGRVHYFRNSRCLFWFLLYVLLCHIDVHTIKFESKQVMLIHLAYELVVSVCVGGVRYFTERDTKPYCMIRTGSRCVFPVNSSKTAAIPNVTTAKNQTIKVDANAEPKKVPDTLVEESKMPNQDAPFTDLGHNMQLRMLNLELQKDRIQVEKERVAKMELSYAQSQIESLKTQLHYYESQDPRNNPKVFKNNIPTKNSKVYGNESSKHNPEDDRNKSPKVEPVLNITESQPVLNNTET